MAIVIDPVTGQQTQVADGNPFASHATGQMVPTGVPGVPGAVPPAGGGPPMAPGLMGDPRQFLMTLMQRIQAAYPDRFAQFLNSPIAQHFAPAQGAQDLRQLMPQMMAAHNPGMAVAPVAPPVAPAAPPVGMGMAVGMPGMQHSGGLGDMSGWFGNRGQGQPPVATPLTAQPRGY